MTDTTDIAAFLQSRRVTVDPVADEAIVGIGHVLTHCRSLLGRLRNEEQGALAGAAPVRSILLQGPAGSGKTLTARWFAGQLGSVAAYDLPVEQLTPSLIRGAFAHLAAAPRSVVFLSEVDAIGLDRRAADRESRRALFALLEALDGLVQVPTVRGPLVIASTTCDRRELDRAVTRPGRLGTIVILGLPTLAERAELYRRMAAPWTRDASISWERLAEMSARWSPADIRGAVDDALGLALLRDGERARLTEDDLVAATRRAGTIEPDDERSFADLPQVALHEAGHTAVAVTLGLTVRGVHLGLGRRGGRTETGTEGAILTDADLRASVVVALGGVAAEQLLSDSPTTGGESDVRKATELLIARIESGLDPDVPPVSRRAWGTVAAPQAIDALIVPQVMRALEAAREQAREIVSRERDAIERFAGRLLAEPDLTGVALDEALVAVGWRTPTTANQQEAA